MKKFKKLSFLSFLLGLTINLAFGAMKSPSFSNSSSSSSSTLTTVATAKNGLKNLGKTCFMNSTIQVLSNVSAPTIKIIKLESLQQKNFSNAGRDCGYFALYNAIQMVDPENKTEASLQKALLKNEQFKNNYDIWKAKLKKSTFLSANEIDEILNNKNLSLPQNQIFVLGDPQLFETLEKTNNPYTKLKELAPKFNLTKLKEIIENLANIKKPFAIIYRLYNTPHWITYGARPNNGSFQIFYTNSLNQQKILSEDITTAIQMAESEDEREAIRQSVQTFNEPIKSVEKSSEENAQIILNLLNDYTKQKRQQEEQQRKAAEQARLQPEAEIRRQQEELRRQQEQEQIHKDEEVARKLAEEEASKALIHKLQMEDNDEKVARNLQDEEIARNLQEQEKSSNKAR